MHTLHLFSIILGFILMSCAFVVSINYFIILSTKFYPFLHKEKKRSYCIKAKRYNQVLNLKNTCQTNQTDGHYIGILKNLKKSSKELLADHCVLQHLKLKNTFESATLAECSTKTAVTRQQQLHFHKPT